MPSGVHNATHLQNWHPERSRASVRPYEIVILSGGPQLAAGVEGSAVRRQRMNVGVWRKCNCKKL